MGKQLLDIENVSNCRQNRKEPLKKSWLWL